MKKTGFTKVLSLFLSLILAFSAFGIVVPTAFAEGSGSVSDAMWNTLANALRSENVKNANYGTSNNVTVDDPSGDITAAAKAYFAVFNAYVHKATSGGKQSNQNEYNLGYRTSQQVRDLIKNKMSSLMGGDYTTYNCASVLNKLGGPNVSSASNTTQSSVPTTQFTITVTNSSQLTGFATLDDVAAVEKYSYTISHRNDRYYETTSGSGCNKKTYQNYYAVVSTVSSSSNTANVDISVLRAYETALNNNAALLDADQTTQIGRGYDVLAAAFQAIMNAKNNAVAKFGEVIVQHFFGAYENKIAALEASLKIAQYSPIVDRINGYVATDISGYDLAALTEIYEALKADYNSYKAIGINEVYAYFETDNEILVRADVDAKYEEIEDAYQIAYLREVVKPQIDADVALYQTYDDDWVLATDNADVAINAAKTAVSGYVTTLATQYNAKNVDVVFGAGYSADVLDALTVELTRLLQVNGYKTRFEEYKRVYTQAFEPVTPDYATDRLYEVLSSKDSWYTELLAFVDEVKTYDEALAEKIFTDLESAMETKINSVYAMLNARVEATVNDAYDLYQGFVAEYGYTINTSDDVTVRNYTNLQQVFGRLNPAHYEFLENTVHFALSEDTVRNYEEIRDAVFAFVNFDASKGLSAYKYNKEYIEDILRQVTAKDVARNADYTVTDEKVEAIINMLEDLLDSDKIKETLDLSGTISGILDNLYTDEFLNTLIQYVYPMVTKEFANVWKGLPSTYPLTDPVETTLTLNIDPMDVALNNLGLPLLPKLLASKVSAAYPAAAAKLNAVPNTCTVDDNKEWVVNPWENANIYDAETKKLTLEWGITDKESFLNAATAALTGVEPLLLALLANKTYSKSNVKVGTGSGRYACVDIKVDPINLNMTFGGNPGYNNALAPILTALGADSLPNGNTLTSSRALLENGVIAPVEQILSKLADKPLDTLLRLLPNLAFALNLNLVAPLLNELKTSIDYKAIAKYDAGIGGSGEKEALSDSIVVNLGEMINLADMGLDISSLNGLLNSVLGLLTKPEEEPEEGAEPAPTISLPTIDEAKLAMLGDEVEWIPGYRTVSPFSGMEGHGSDFARIVTNNRADVFLFLIDYLMKGMTKPEGADESWQSLLDQVVALLNYKAEHAEPAEGEEPVEAAKIEISEALQQIIDNIVNNYTDSIAAIVELIFPQAYDMSAVKKIDWITEGNFDEGDYAHWTEETAAEYDSLWTREEAVFVESHLEDVLNYIVALLSDKLGGAKTLPEAAQALLGGLFTADTANKIPAALKDLLGGIELPEAVADLGLLEQLGLDLTAWDNMTFEFEDGDEEAFKNALITALQPLSKILGFVLAGQDIELTLFDAVPVKALGYDGYSYGIVPLLEALYADNVKTPAEFQADAANVVKNVIDPVFTVIDHLTADPLGFIRTVLPNVVYFNKCEGIQTAIPNLLFAVNVLLDTIRPVYDVNLYELVDEKLGFDLRFAETDPLDFLLTTVAGLVGDMTADENGENGLKLTIDFTAQDISDTLHFSKPTAFTSANGDPAYRISLTEDGRADLMCRTLDYVILQVLYEDNYDQIVNMVAGLFGEEGVPEIITEILTNVKENYPDSIVAAVRFLFPERKNMRQEYNTYPRLADKGYSPLKAAPVIEWITEGNIGAAEDDNLAFEVPEGEHTLWTQEKAVYMAEHLGDFLNDIVVIFGEQLGGAQTLEEAVDFLVKDLFTAENANKIAAAVKDLVAGIGLPDTIFDVAAQLGIDMHAWDTMSFSFADGDKTAFKNALITILKPVEPVLRMILVDGGDLEGTVLGALPITIHGYDGYSYGIVPLLEALGASGVKTTAAFKSDKTHVVENIVNPLFTVVDHLMKNPLKFIEDVIPELIYYDKVGGIQVAIPNLLYAVNVVLDTIYPIYPIDIYALVEEKTGVDLKFAEESPVDFLLQTVADLVTEKTNIELKIDFTVATLSETLHFTDPEKFTSANGDDAYRIKLTAQGKADLLSNVLDYGINQVIFEDNFDKLSEIFEGLISDDDTRAFLIGILDIMKHADDQYAEGTDASSRKIHDVALAQLFWIFFGADSATDAIADFFYRYKDSNFFEMLYLISDKAPDYIQRIRFLMTEIYSVEYPEVAELIAHAEDYLKPPYEYNEHETKVVSGFLGRLLAFFVRIIDFIRHLFNK